MPCHAIISLFLDLRAGIKLCQLALLAGVFCLGLNSTCQTEDSKLRMTDPIQCLAVFYPVGFEISHGR